MWRRYDEWPPKAAAAKTLYFHAGGKLSFDPPDEDGKLGRVPERSQPSGAIRGLHHGHGSAALHGGRPALCQLPARRGDYETDPLTEDVTIAGPISPHLKVASSGTDSDFDVKLIDVYPEEYPDPMRRWMGTSALSTRRRCTWAAIEQLLRGEPFRAKFRSSWEKPEPLTPGKETAIDFTMPDLYHTFRRGHRIMVQVQSSWFPLTDRNPQTFTDIPYAKPEDFKKATEQIFHQKDAASGVEILVLPQP